jgi:hypothetical protein
MITVEKATRNLQRKIRKVSSEALPDLLFIGTRNRSGTGRLDRVIDGLEQRLCKAMERGYPKIAAAAIIEKRRSQEPCIAAAAKAMAKRGAPNPEVRADSERPIAVQKVEPLTDRKSAARARRKANKNKLKAQQAEASAAEARDNLNKGADMDSMITIAKSVIAGKPSAFTKRDFFIEMQKRADQGRQPNETREKAFERYATADPNGHGQLKNLTLGACVGVCSGWKPDIRVWVRNQKFARSSANSSVVAILYRASAEVPIPPAPA